MRTTTAQHCAELTHTSQEISTASSLSKAYQTIARGTSTSFLAFTGRAATLTGRWTQLLAYQPQATSCSSNRACRWFQYQECCSMSAVFCTKYSAENPKVHRFSRSSSKHFNIHIVSRCWNRRSKRRSFPEGHQSDKSSCCANSISLLKQELYS